MRFLFKPAENFFRRRYACRVEREKLRAVQIDAGPRRQHSPRREETRIAWNDDAFDAELAAWMDREPARLDPIEHAVLLIRAYELKEQPEVPFRVVINEGVTLARRFGATDGHKFVNAVLDRAARTLRPNEH